MRGVRGRHRIPFSVSLSLSLSLSPSPYPYFFCATGLDVAAAAIQAASASGGKHTSGVDLGCFASTWSLCCEGRSARKGPLQMVHWKEWERREREEVS